MTPGRTCSAQLPLRTVYDLVLQEAQESLDFARVTAVRQVAGVDARSYPRGQADPAALADPSAALRLLLCHYPSVVGRLPLGSFQLVLSGHLHGGQIVLPLPRKRLTLAHPRSRYVSGLYETSAGPIHVSPGTGTTFIPFRFFARPEVTELVLRSSAYDPFMETVSIGAPGDCGQAA